MLSNWERLQILKRNTVRVNFEDLNPLLQILIGHHGFPHEPLLFSQLPLRQKRTVRGVYDFATVTLLRPTPEGIIVPGLLFGARTLYASGIQKMHDKIADYMKRFGILKGGQPETKYPPDWINPTIVAETHPLFSIQRNGDVIFRRVTKKEFVLLKVQQKLIGKAGLNVWRWRGTLRRPEAPEVERAKLSERMKQLLARLKPIRRPRTTPAFAPVLARKKLFARRRG